MAWGGWECSSEGETAEGLLHVSRKGPWLLTGEERDSATLCAEPRELNSLFGSQKGRYSAEPNVPARTHPARFVSHRQTSAHVVPVSLRYVGPIALGAPAASPLNFQSERSLRSPTDVGPG